MLSEYITIVVRNTSNHPSKGYHGTDYEKIEYLK